MRPSRSSGSIPHSAFPEPRSPGAVGIGRPPPIAERPIAIPCGQESAEVLPGFVVERLLGAFDTEVSALAVTQCENWLKFRPAGS